MPQADGQWKNRPALLLCRVQPFGDLLLCGISTQFRHKVPDFDEEITPNDEDFADSNLIAPSLIRLGFLTTIAAADIKGTLGRISEIRRKRLVLRLSEFLKEEAG